MNTNINQIIVDAILQEIIKIRRPFHSDLNNNLQPNDLTKLFEVQAPQIQYFIENQLPLLFVLPAFPMKSPNLDKVLGVLPDMAEFISLNYLVKFCHNLKAIYSPGAKIIICSDGRVFGDVIQVSDSTITAYQQGLRTMIDELNTECLDLFNLEDSDKFNHINFNFDAMRTQLVTGYADTSEKIKQQLIGSQHGLALYRAMTRFLFEDSLTPSYQGSRSALQKQSKICAITVIQRSWAWGRFLKEQFPHAIRFSIHPQPVDNKKIGIHMMPTNDNWLTPWHGVAVDINNQFVLMKRSQAIKLAAKLIYKNQHKSHYKIP